MQIGMVGLGRMGANMVRRLLRAGHDCVVYDRDAAARAALAADGARAADNLADLVQALVPPRAIWLMLPEGAITQENLDTLAGLLAPGDMLIDGGNSFWKDDIRRATALREKGLIYLDVGTSGGVWGLERGYCLMIGGPEAAVQHLDPIFAALAPGRGEIAPTAGRENRDPRVEQGYLHAGGNGAGHYVKMIHNAIEYGMMQAMAEGFDIMRHAGDDHVTESLRLDLDVADIAEVWRRGSVVTSWLLDLTASALAKDGDLAAYSGQVNDSGEGRWALQAAVEQAVPAEVLSAALFARFRSRRNEKFAEKVLSAMRAGFGGHAESK